MMENKITPEQKKALEQPLPTEAVSKHPTKSYLSSIKAIYVSERLNNVFGIGSWYMDAEIVDNSSKMIVLKCTFYLTTHGLKFTHFGGNDNQDKGDAYKGAMTDALTKIAAQHFNIGLEVFKGQATEQPTKTDNKPTEQQPEKPWLNEGTAEYKKVVEAMKKGYTIQQVRKKYAVNKKVAATLEAITKIESIKN